MRLFLIFVFVIFYNNSYGQFKNLGGPNFGNVVDYVFDGDRIYVLSKYSIHYSDDEGMTWTFVRGSNNLGPLNKISIDGKLIYASISDNFYLKSLNKIFKYENGIWEHLSYYKVNTDFSFSTNVSFYSFQDTLVVFKSDTLYVSKDHGKSQFVEKKLNNSYLSYSLLNFKGSHYYVNGDAIVKTSNFVKEEVIGSFEASYNKLIRNEDNLFLCRYYLQSKIIYILENDKFKEVYREQLFGDISSIFDREKYTYEGNTIYKLDYFFEYSDDNAISFHNRNLYEYIGFFAANININKNKLFYTINSYLYKANLENDLSSIENITNNFSSANIKFDINGNKIILKQKLSINYQIPIPPIEFNIQQKKWIKYPRFDTLNYCFIVDDNKFIYYNNLKYDSIYFCDSLRTISKTIANPPAVNGGLSFVTSINKMLTQVAFNNPLISIDKGATWQLLDIGDGYEFEYINGHFIAFDRYKTLNSTDGINWKQTIFIDQSQVFDLFIKSATIGDDGKIFVQGSDNNIYFLDSISSSLKTIKLPFANNEVRINVLNYYKGVLFLGTEGEGIFKSTDYGVTWQSVSQGLDNNFITDIKIANDKVYIGTYCFLYEISLMEFLNIKENVTDGLNVFPNPVLDKLSIHTDKSIFQIQLYTLNGKLINTFYGTNELDVQTLEKGIYFLKIKEIDGTISIKRFIKM